MTVTSAEREQVLTEIDQSWTELTTVLQTFDDSELRIPSVIGIWSLKDLLGHLATWDQIATRKLELTEAGDERPWWEADNISMNGIDEFNESDARAKSHLPIDRLWSQLFAAHDAMVNRVRETPVLSRELIAEDTYDHYRGHLNDIRNWQADRVARDTE